MCVISGRKEKKTERKPGVRQKLYWYTAVEDKCKEHSYIENENKYKMDILYEIKCVERRK